jgi:4-amino-4-deoxy-L-arabinose transferase-like glycosyltransferase
MKTNLFADKKTFTLFAITLIIAVGFFLRIYNIENTPPGIYPDEAVNGEDALRANATGEYQWFYPANQGREGLFMNLIAMCFKFFGVSILTLKLPAILSSTLTILGVYLLTKELFGKRAGLVSAYLTAFSFWAINFGRISFRANMLPMVLSFSFYFLYKGLRTRKKLDFALGGIIFGIGLHTYIAFRIAPLILIIALFALIISRENFLKSFWKHILVFIFWTALVSAPMLYTIYIAHPEYAESRSSAISVFSPERNFGHPYLTLLRSFSLSLIKYNLVGDQNFRHNYPPYALLDPISGTAFVFGFIYSLITIFKLAYLRFKKKIRDTKLDIHIFLMAWFFAMLVPEFLTAEGNPHALRSIGTLPVVFVFTSLTFTYLLNHTKNSTALFRKVNLSLIIFALIALGLFNSIKYHYFWANKPIVGSSFNKNITDMSKFIQTMPKEQEKFVITSYNTLIKLPILIFNQDNNVSFFYPNELERIQPKNPANFTIFFTENNQEAIQAMQQKFPNLQLQEVDETLGSVYYILK